mgnify:CR=1 FL=1
MSTNTKSSVVLQAANLVSLNHGGLLDEMPELFDGIKDEARAVVEAAKAREDADAALAKACSDGGIPAADIHAKDADRRFKASALIAARDAYVDAQHAHQDYGYTRDAFQRAFAANLTDPDVLSELGQMFTQIGDALQVVEQQAAVLTAKAQRLEGVINGSVRDLLRTRGEGSPVVTNDVARDTLPRISQRAHTRGRVLAELGDA